MEDDGEGGEFCTVQSREDGEKDRAELKKERENRQDPVHIADCIAKLERFGLIVPVGTDYRPEYPPYPDENEDSLLETPASKRPLTLRNVNVKEGEENNTLRKRTVSLLDEQTTKKLQEGGLDPDYIRFLGSRSGCAGALKESANPVKAANTMIARDWFKDQFKAWIKKHPAE
jgi:hypothetical protein